MDMEYIDLPLVYGKLNPEIKKGFEEITRNIQPMIYVPTNSSRCYLSDTHWYYKIATDVIDPSDRDKCIKAVVVIEKTYDEIKHQNIYKLISYREC